MYLVGFIIRIYHDAWSSEYQIRLINCKNAADKFVCYILVPSPFPQLSYIRLPGILRSRFIYQNSGSFLRTEQKSLITGSDYHNDRFKSIHILPSVCSSHIRWHWFPIHYFVYLLTVYFGPRCLDASDVNCGGWSGFKRHAILKAFDWVKRQNVCEGKNKKLRE